MALTATADDATRKDIVSRLQLVDPHTYLGGFDRPNIRYNLVEAQASVSGGSLPKKLRRSSAASSTVVAVKSWDGHREAV